MSSERRRHPRIEVDAPVRVHSGAAVIEGRLRDLSMDATLIEAARTCPIGTAVDLELTLPDDDVELRLTGQVIRLADDGDQPQMAVLFSDLPPTAATRIDLFLARQSTL
jgi:hypothetical protein